MAAKINEIAELRARRLLAQGLARHSDSPIAAVRWLLAVQAQLYNSGKELLEVRSADPSEDIAAGRIVRTWSQRGTHHFLAAEDAQWMMLLCHPRIERAAEKRRATLKLSQENFRLAQKTLFEALLDGPVSRTEAYQLFAAAGVDPEGGRGPHILRSLGSCGGMVQAPREGNVDRFMLVEHLEGPIADFSGDGALAELAQRYFTSRGPATVQDLAWWAGITVTAARRGLAKTTGLIEMELAGKTYWMGDFQAEFNQADFAEALEQKYELPAFDEYLIGYKDRSAQLPAELVPEVGPTRNGIMRPFTVVDGIVIGMRE